jgi:uncharacterized protein (DUF1778 family)
MSSKSSHLQIRVTPEQKSRLKRLAEAAGRDVSSYVLSRVLPPSQERFQEILVLLAEEAEHRYGLAELNDLLSELGPEELRTAVAHADLEGLTPFLQNYVAAMVEQASRLRGVRAPGWTAAIPSLERPFFAASLRSLRLHLLRASPVPFKRRNLFVDSGIGDRV